MADYAAAMIPHKLASNFVETHVDDETLIVDMDGGLLFSLSGTGQAVWNAIDGMRSSSEIAADMASAYRGEACKIAADIEELLADFAAARLIALRG